MKTISWIFIGLVAGSTMANGADYIGARMALEKAAANSQKEEADSPGKLEKDLEAFRAEAAALAPKDAAARWLALVERGLKAASKEMRHAPGQEFANFVKALPPPAAWPELRTALAAREATIQTLGLRWFANRLLGDAKAMQADYEAIGRLLEEADPNARRLLEMLDGPLFAISDDGGSLLKMLNASLDDATRESGGPADRYRETEDFPVPDLVTLAGREKAAAFLTRALTSLNRPIFVRRGEETQRLASELALKNAANLKTAQWGLAAEVKGGELYRALIEKFGEPGEPSREFGRAQAFELLRLLLAGKMDEALALSKKMDPSHFAFLGNVEQSDAVAVFFGRLLAENPGLPYWHIYIEAAVQAGKSAEMLKLVRATLKDEKVRGESRTDLEEALLSALLAAGELDEAIPILVRNAEKDGDPRRSRYRNDGAETIARIGMLTDRKEWVTQGLSLAAREWGRQQKTGRPEDASFATSYARLLTDLNRGPEAEAVLVTALGAAEAEDQDPNAYRPVPATQDILSALVELYARAGRYSDVLVLLDEAPGWGAADLKGIRRPPSMFVWAARALAAAGKEDEARRILNTLLDRGTNDDRAYELLIELDGQNAMATLDRAFAQDPFEERPLIWKAKLLLEAGKVDEAEKVAREAIKIDPSDGEQGPGDRMRVYDVLAAALAAKGDIKGAEFFQGVTKAIRLSEKADRFYALGLHAPAIKLYGESLTYFADAYCIQSRLALRLSEMGNWKAAAEHYRKAYELMPDSFGRVESHCFGCERAFAGERQQTIAEKVFTDMAASRPDKPQVHYLLGYLRMENGRYREALTAFKKAVELDPDYLNAWKKLDGLGEYMHLPTEWRNAIASNLLRLDPWQRHGAVSLEGITDLGAMWDKLAAFYAKVPPAPKELYPLKGSAAALEAIKAKRASNPRYAMMWQAEERSSSHNDRDLSPGGIFSRQDFTRAVERYLQYSQRMRH